MADEPIDFSQTTTDGARPQRAPSGQSTNRKVVVIPLSNDRQFTSQSTTFKYFLVGPRVLMGIGPQIEDCAA